MALEPVASTVPDMITCRRVPPVTFDLMRLPIEIRLIIYKFALVRGVIRIVSTAHPFEKMPYYDRNDRVNIYAEEPNPIKSEILRSNNQRIENVKDIAGSSVGDEVTYSYGLQPGQSPPLVNIFLTSRIVYSETWPIFYRHNAFSFALPSNTEITAVNCLRFLWDRPYHALRHIGELHLLVGNAPHQPFRHKLATHTWQTLFEEINRYLSVRVLVLYIRGRTDDALDHRWSDLPWRDWLCKINGLQELHIDIATQSTDEQNLELVKHLQSRMVVGGDQLGTEGFTLTRRKIPNLGWCQDLVLNILTTSPNIPNLEENFCFNFE